MQPERVPASAGEKLRRIINLSWRAVNPAGHANSGRDGSGSEPATVRATGEAAYAMERIRSCELAPLAQAWRAASGFADQPGAGRRIICIREGCFMPTPSRPANLSVNGAPVVIDGMGFRPGGRDNERRSADRQPLLLRRSLLSRRPRQTGTGDVSATVTDPMTRSHDLRMDNDQARLNWWPKL